MQIFWQRQLWLYHNVVEEPNNRSQLFQAHNVFLEHCMRYVLVHVINWLRECEKSEISASFSSIFKLQQI